MRNDIRLGPCLFGPGLEPAPGPALGPFASERPEQPASVPGLSVSVVSEDAGAARTVVSALSLLGPRLLHHHHVLLLLLREQGLLLLLLLRGRRCSLLLLLLDRLRRLRCPLCDSRGEGEGGGGRGDGRGNRGWGDRAGGEILVLKGLMGIVSSRRLKLQQVLDQVDGYYQHV